MKDIIRVAVNNNFFCTDAEWNQLEGFTKVYPESLFFINSNIKTPKLLTINDHPYKAVITLNPDLIPVEAQWKRLYDIVSDQVAFVRIKYIPDVPEIIDLIKKVSKTHTVVITLQRFNQKVTINKYVPNFRDHYTYKYNWYHLDGESLKEALKLEGTNGRTFFCDKQELGCGGCGICSKLVAGGDYEVQTLNMSTSGRCQYHCPDCYAVLMQERLEKWGKTPIRFDWVHQNCKQTGRLKRIKDQKKKKAA
jgi:hypothetical protein